MTARRRLYLMRHADVSYFGDDGAPAQADDVPLTARGREQARAAAAALDGIGFDRVLTSGLRRTVETARIVAPDARIESWPELRELQAGRLADIPDAELEAAFTGAFRGAVPLETRFIGGETLRSLLERVVPAVQRLLDDPDWDAVLAVLHGGVNRAILSYALAGEGHFLGGFEQAPACINILDVGPGWIVRAVNHAPYDPLHAGGRGTTMEALYNEYVPFRQSPGRLSAQRTSGGGPGEPGGSPGERGAT